MSRFAQVMVVSNAKGETKEKETTMAVSVYRERRSELALMVARLTDQAEKFKKMKKFNTARYYLDEADRLLGEMQNVTITGARRKVAWTISEQEDRSKRRAVR